MSVLIYLPRFRGAKVALNQLAEQETWSRARIENRQLDQLNQLWSSAREHVPYLSAVVGSSSLAFQLRFIAGLLRPDAAAGEKRRSRHAGIDSFAIPRIRFAASNGRMNRNSHEDVLGQGNAATSALRELSYAATLRDRYF